MERSRSAREPSGFAFETCSMPAWVYDRDTRGVLAVNDAALAITGFARGELLRTPLERLAADGAHNAFEPAELRRIRRADGRVVEIEVCASVPIVYEGGEAKLDVFQAFVDRPTGLPDRLALLRAEATASATLMLVRIGWSARSVQRGQEARDAGARAAAAVIEPLLADGTLLARFAGDTFAIRLRGTRTRPAVALARRLLTAFERPMAVDGGELSATPAIGIAAGGTDVAAQARDAEAALDRAIAAGTSVEIFDAELAREHDRRVVIERNLRHAILDGRVTVVFQPIVSLTTAEVAGAEALMRWDCPGLGPVAPPEFIAIAEESRAILRLGEWILREACAQNRRWQLAGLPPIRITVNVSPRQVAQRDFVKLVSAIAEATSLLPSDLEIELTGSALVSRDDASRRAIEAVRRLGVRVSIDEFGSGYSAIGDLGSLPADTLKLDRAFVQELGRDRFKTEAAAAVIRLAHGQGLRVVGVGVETAEQVAVLREMECDEAQGFLLGAPGPADAFAARLERDRLRAAVVPARSV